MINFLERLDYFTFSPVMYTQFKGSSFPTAHTNGSLFLCLFGVFFGLFEVFSFLPILFLNDRW